MKKILFISTLLIVLFACKENSKKDSKEESKDGTLVNLGTEKTPIYYMTLEAEDGDKTKKKVEF